MRPRQVNEAVDAADGSTRTISNSSRSYPLLNGMEMHHSLGLVSLFSKNS
jgi:hypothetical protein